MRYTNAILIIIALNLSGCAAVEAYKDLKAESIRKSDGLRMSKAQTSCQKYGFKQGTDSFSTCLQNEINAMLGRETIEKAARDAESIIPKTTSCSKTLTGMDCTTQ